LSIVFLGFASCGKSATARVVAERLSLPFVDLDREIEALHRRETGGELTCREIARQEGMPFFRDLEHRALRERLSAPPCVLAPGGGAPLREENREILVKLAPIVYLCCQPEALFERMQGKGLPVFLRDDPTLENLTAVWQERHPVYAALADVTVDNSALSIEATADAVLAAVNLERK
jgi:shikimate kinase